MLSVLFFVGVWETGVGYVLDWEWPAWVITLIDASAALSLWYADRTGSERPWRGAVLTAVAAALMLARALWFVLVPIAVTLTVAGSIARVTTSRRSPLGGPGERRCEQAS